MGNSKTWTHILILALVVLVAGGGLFYAVQRNRLCREAEDNLRTITEFKARQISNWFLERQGDAAILGATLSLSDEVDQLLVAASRATHPIEATRSERYVKSAFERIRTHYGFREVQLVNHQGRVVVSVAGLAKELDPDKREAVLAAMRDGQPRLVDLHVCANGNTPHLSWVAPVRSVRAPEGAAIGVVVLMADAADFLYPLIQSWPRSSRTAETVLVRQVGDSVVFLNDLRHKPGTALRYRLPLTQSDLPAVWAVTEGDAVRHGKDYRGVDVLAATRFVEGTPWAIVSKEDAAEALSFMRHQSTLVILVVVVLLLAIGIGLALVRQREERHHLHVLLQKERELGRAARHHQVVLQSIGDAVMATDAEGRVDLMNPEAERQTGWTLEQAHGKPLEEIFQIVNEETGDTVESPVSRVIRERKVVGLANHTLLINRAGDRHPIADSGAPIEEDDGTLSGVVLVFRDQTEERIAKGALEQSERRFRSTFEQAAVGMAHTDSEGRVLRANEATCRMLGYTQAELASMTYHQVSHPDEFAEDLVARIKLMAGTEASVSREKQLLRKDGSLFWATVTVSLVRDTNGEPAYFISVLQDITTKRQAKEALRRMKYCVDNASDMVFWIAPDGRILYTNKAAEVQTGYPIDELLTLSIYDLDIELRHDDWPKHFNGLREQGSILFETQHRHKDGHAYPVEAHATYVSFDGQEFNFAFARDISSRKEAEREQEALRGQLVQSQKMEAVGRLAGGVAHDFNNILQALLGYGNMLQEVMPADSEAAEFADEIVNGAHRAAALTRQLLAFSRKQNIQPRVLDLNDTIVGMLKLLGRLIAEEIDLQWHPANNLQPVRMDPEQINQVLVNLVVNARDAIEGTGAITIETDAAVFDEEYCGHHEGAVPGSYVVLAVSDTGCGMDELVKAKIFEPFYTTKGLGKGTGLGLATVYGVVKQNGGFINVYSEPNQGTTFRIYLPIHEGGIVEETAGQPAGPIYHGTETILVVEDERPLLRFAEQLLKSMGYTVIAAESPMRALELAQAYPAPIHLLLTDVIMPQMSGRELYNALLKQRPDLPCLYMSGYTSNVIAHRSILEEGVHFLAKPFTRQELATKLRVILDVQ
ncbi:MAG: PAS domain S-box protein [Candidatus Delongbacteria bacterium]